MIFCTKDIICKQKMRHLSTILSLIALVLIAILFFMFFNHTEQLKKISVATEKQSASTFKIAYFSIDSLEAHYNYFKDMLTQAKTKENTMNNELGNMERSYQQKIAEWRKKGSGMSQKESEQAQQEYGVMQQNLQARRDALGQEMFKYNEDMKSDVKKKIENFLKEYNKQKNFSFIFAYEPNSFIYYKDTVYDITQDLLDGLNAGYRKKN